MPSVSILDGAEEGLREKAANLLPAERCQSKLIDRDLEFSPSSG